MEDKKREQILTDFSKNILIEAGAGSGKTTILVNRILNQIKATEITMDKIVAITFTDKSAIELQDRFQAQLSKDLQLATGEEKQKLKKAMADVDKIHISTIHSFCLGLLKEMPFEAGLSLDTTVVQDQLDMKFKKEIFSNFCEADLSHQDLKINQLKAQLREVDINPEILQNDFFSICEKDGVTWVYDKDVINTDAQEFFNRGKKILELIQAVLSSEYDPAIGFTEEELRLGGAESEDQTPIIKEDTCLALKWLARTRDQEPSSEILDIIAKLDKSLNICVAQNSKSKNYSQVLLEMGKQVNKKLKELKLDLACANLKEDYSRYRHALCVQFLIKTIAYFNLEKKKEKKLTNKDLLVMARNMIRDSAVARAFFKAKYHCFYIDEFQDTDPIQTELLFYLVSEQMGLPDNWEDCQLKDGTLCMVGDPKQSIYAFTGADIKLYNRVKEKMEKDDNCVVYGLQRNYRSNKKICNWVEYTFSKKESNFGFPDSKEPGNNQAVFEGMNAFANGISNDESTLNGVYRYHIGAGTKDELVKRDAVFVAEMVADLIENKTQINDYNTLSKTFFKRNVSPGDFLILTWNTTHMSDYVLALKKKGLPVSVSGKIETKALEEVNNLVDLLDYLNDQNNYQLAVVLEKLFGCHLEEDKLFNYNHLLLNHAEELNAIQDENLKASLIYLRNLLDLTKEFSPMMVVEQIINDFKVIRANKKYDANTLNEAMGNLEQVMEVVRSEPYSTFSDIASRLKNLTESHLDREMSITDLIQEDGNHNAVRIMNLHKSKGLEGNIVILANPSIKAKGYSESVILIDETDQKNGYLKIKTSTRKILGAPAGWGEAECINDRSKVEEYLRLLYVASTRAKEALIVSSADTLERSKTVNHTAWKELEEFISCDDHTGQLFNGALNHEVLLRNSLNIEDRQSEVWGIVDIEDGFQKHQNQINQKIKHLQKSLINHVNPSKTIHKISDADQKSGKHNSETTCFRGTLYGTIVHQFFQQLIERIRVSDDQIDERELKKMIKKSVIAGLESEPLTEHHCELLKLNRNLIGVLTMMTEQTKAIYNVLNDDLLKKYDAFCADEVFLKLIKKADAVYAEMPFQLMIRPEELIECSPILTSNNKKTSIRGVMDLVLVNGNNYTIIDFKTNSKEDEEENLAIFKDRLTAMYRPQLDLYEIALKKMMGASDVKSMLYVV
jgi:ATP-dependent exoDNAse (exonuclease V) beta subunit (contains helicase and exonuclease domains)